MARLRSNKPYRFIEAAGRNIQCVFAHIPGKRYSTGTTDRDMAVLWAEEFLRTDGHMRDSTPTFGEFAKDFFLRDDPDSLSARSEGNGRGHGPEWGPNNQRRLDMYIMPKFGRYLITAITPVMVENWCAGLRVVGTGRRMANTTKAGLMSTLSVVMDDALRKGIIQNNPARLALQPEVDRSTSDKRSLTQWEERTLFPQKATERIVVWGDVADAALFSVMHDTGFRPNEVCGLRIDNIYTTPKGMAVCTDHTINGATRMPRDAVKTSGKGARNRVGLLSPVTEELVRMHIDMGGVRDGWLFLNKRGGFQAPADAWKRSKAVFVRYGFDDLTQYCLRHTFITRRRGEMEEAVLAMSAGHSGGVRDNYDHRNAAVLISQLEKSRDEIFMDRDEPEILPFQAKKKA